MPNTDATVPAPQLNRVGPTRSREEIARLGDEIYERDIRQEVEAVHQGKIVSIDVDSGKWAIAGELLEAADRLRAQRPEAINVWSLRVGNRAVYRFGGGSLSRRPR